HVENCYQSIQADAPAVSTTENPDRIVNVKITLLGEIASIQGKSSINFTIPFLMNYQAVSYTYGDSLCPHR
ncbi:MAG: hypothetical protein ACO24O_08110, partial [Arenimonas sp.]